MILLNNVALPQTAYDQLDRYQQEIAALGSYEAQVKNSTWNVNKEGFAVVKATLQKMVPGNATCHYCGQQRATTIDHFRPRNLFPERTYVWENYLWACNECNGSSGKWYHFAVFDDNGKFHEIGRHPTQPIQQPISGVDVFINPRYENPLDYFQVTLTSTDAFSIQPLDGLNPKANQRARYTIEKLKLNRPTLINAREAAFGEYLDWLDGYINRKNDANALSKHINRLRTMKQYHAVWEEMRLTYLHRDLARWPTLIAQNPNTLGELDRYFSDKRNSEVLDISFISV